MKKLLYIALTLTILNPARGKKEDPVINTDINENGEYTSGRISS